MLGALLSFPRPARLFEQLDRLGISAGAPIGDAEIVPAEEGVWVVGPSFCSRSWSVASNKRARLGERKLASCSRLPGYFDSEVCRGGRDRLCSRQLSLASYREIASVNRPASLYELARLLLTE